MKEQTLRILEVERFAIHDGAGIRTVVFLQGCPLRCPWCANPEAQEIKKQLLHLQSKCVGCGRCATACAQGAIRVEANGRPVFNRARCIGCESCARACLQDAIQFAGRELTVDEILAEVLRDRDYYEESGGGVTFSGGEPFVQYAGFLALLRRCKEAGLNTAVETTGDVELAQMKEVLPLIDTFLFDLKHTDTELLWQVAKGNLPRILASLTCIVAECPEKIILRVPVIPQFNYNEKTLAEIFALARRYHIPQVHLLPYHTLGKGKYAQLGRDYPYPVDKMLAKQELLPYQKQGEALGLMVRIGG